MAISRPTRLNGGRSFTSFRAETGPFYWTAESNLQTLICPPLQTLSIEEEKRTGGRNWGVVGQQGRRLAVCLCACPVSFAAAPEGRSRQSSSETSNKKKPEGDDFKVLSALSSASDCGSEKRWRLKSLSTPAGARAKEEKRSRDQNQQVKTIFK